MRERSFPRPANFNNFLFTKSRNQIKKRKKPHKEHALDETTLITINDARKVDNKH